MIILLSMICPAIPVSLQMLPPSFMIPVVFEAFSCVSMDGGTTQSTFETLTSDSSGIGDDHGHLSKTLARNKCNVLCHLDGIIAITDLPLATAARKKEFMTQCRDE